MLTVVTGMEVTVPATALVEIEDAAVTRAGLPETYGAQMPWK